MKRFPIVLVLALALSPVPALADPPADLADPGFEDGLAGWDAAGDNGMSAAAPEAAHAGVLGLRVNDARADAGSSLASAKFAVTPGKVYQVRFWARAVAGQGAGVYVAFADAAGKPFLGSKESEDKYQLAPLTVPGGQDEWKEFLLRKTAPEGAAQGWIWIHSYTAAESTTDFDDFHLAELDR